MKVLHISTFSPTPCGIATYCEDLIKHQPSIEAILLRMAYGTDGLSKLFWRTVPIHLPEAYREAIEAANGSDIDVVSLQHEFGIFGGADGDLVTLFADEIRKPLVTTLHTTSPTLPPSKRKIIKCLVKRSNAIVVLSDASGRLLSSQFGADAAKVNLIRHGIPAVEFRQPGEIGLRTQLGCDFVFVSAGHIRPAKGYEVALSALAMFKESGANFRYLILGTNQPQWDPEGLAPRKINGLIRELGLKDQVLWIPKYLPLEELLCHIQAADIGLVTYTARHHTSSGILPMILGCGRLAVATRFEFAECLAGSVDGLYLCELNSPTSLCEAIHKAVKNVNPANTMMRSNYDRTRDWLWQNSAQRYMAVFEQAVGTKRI
jgi:glycosyltransferase involved in cell wall biosynthesis